MKEEKEIDVTEKAAEVTVAQGALAELQATLDQFREDRTGFGSPMEQSRIMLGQRLRLRGVPAVLPDKFGRQNVRLAVHVLCRVL